MITFPVAMWQLQTPRPAVFNLAVISFILSLIGFGLHKGRSVSHLDMKMITTAVTKQSLTPVPSTWIQQISRSMKTMKPTYYLFKSKTSP